MNGVLPYQELLGLVPNAIVKGDKAYIRTASYDMRIGDEYYLYDEKCPDGREIRSRSQGVIVIPPNGLLLCTMYETLKLPPDIVGHLSLKVSLLMKGVMMASQSQIDAGYEGKIFGLLYNLSHKAVCLREGEFVLRLELMRMEQPTAKPYDNSVSRNGSLNRYIDAPLISSLVSIREDASTAVDKVDQARRSLNVTQVIGTLLIAIAGATLTWHFAPDSKVEQLSQAISKLGTQMTALEAGIPSRLRLDELEKQNKALQERLDKIEANPPSKTSKNGRASRTLTRIQPYLDTVPRQETLGEPVEVATKLPPAP